MRVLSALAIVALAAACGDTTLITDGHVERLDDTNQARPSAESITFSETQPLPLPSFELYEPLPQTVMTDLRIRGSNGAAFHGVLLRAHQLRIAIDGVDVPYTVHAEEVDVANAGHAWKLATFEMPQGARFVQVLLDIDDESGSFVGLDDAGKVIAPGAPIYFESPASLVARQAKVVLDLDLGRSLVANSSAELEMVPVFRIHY